MPTSPSRSHSSVPNGRLVDFDEAVIMDGPLGGTRFLRVRGVVHDDELQVKLAPRIYSLKPDYWVVEVVAVTTREPTERSFQLSIPIDAVTGHAGITVRGASREETFAV